MKQIHSLLSISLCAWAGLITAHAQLVIPSDGSDGVLDIIASTVIDLSQATTAKWNADNTAHAGQGVYDPDKWAIVFKYRSVKIAAGATVTFANHPSRAPVVWLVAGDVTIAGAVNLTPEVAPAQLDAINFVEPGPGGFRGGISGPQGNGNGFGPGASSSYASTYGNPQILPLIGGSGGGANNQNGGGPFAGGAGAGALLIAANKTINLTGYLIANGGPRQHPNTPQGSGGAIKLIASEIAGSGRIEAANDGRIRLETITLSTGITFNPETIAVSPAMPPVIWPADNSPKVRILRADGVDSPTEPTAPLTRTADIVLQNDNASEIVLETTNFPLEGIVELKNTLKFGGSTGWIRATYVGGDFARATWKISYAFPKGFNALQARAFLP